MTCGLVHASYSLPEWQAIKLNFFAPCQRIRFFVLLNLNCLSKLQKKEFLSYDLWSSTCVSNLNKI